MGKINHKSLARSSKQHSTGADRLRCDKRLAPWRSANRAKRRLRLPRFMPVLALIGFSSPGCSRSGEGVGASQGEAIRAIHSQDYAKAIELLKSLAAGDSGADQIAGSSPTPTRTGKRPLKRFGQAVMLKDDPEIIRKYEEYHANTWPEVLAGVRKAGVRRTFIYRFDRLLFMFMEADPDFDMERDMPKYMEDPRAKEWDELMRTYQEPLPGVPEGTTWVQMKEVFAFDSD